MVLSREKYFTMPLFLEKNAFRYDFEILPSKILYLTKAIESENDMLFSKVSLI